MKTLLYNICRALILIFFVTGCTSDDLIHSEAKSQKKVIPVQFTLTQGQESIERSEALSASPIFEEDIHWAKVSHEQTRWDSRTIPQLRTTWPTVGGATTWSPGDAVGIYMRRNTGVQDSNIDKSNTRYITTTNTKTGSLAAAALPLVFPNSVTDKVDFFAYYPFSKTPEAGDVILSPIDFQNISEEQLLDLKYALPTNQTSQLALRNADLMYAEARNLDNTVSNVNLDFNHLMTLVTIRIKSTDFNGVTITKATLRGSKVTNQGTFHLNSGLLSPSPLSFNPYALINQALNDVNYIYVDLIINPCAVQANTNGSEMRIVLTIGNIDYTYIIPSGTVFLPGYRNTYTMTIANIQGNNVYVYVWKEGQVQIDETILVGEAIGSFDNSTTNLPAIITPAPGWIPYRVIFDGSAIDLPPTPVATYNIPQGQIKNRADFLFRPQNWYPVDDLLIHYDGIYAGGFGHSFTNDPNVDNYGDYNNSVWTDLSGNNNHGELERFNYNTSSGWNNNGLKFDGSNDIVNYPGIITGSYTMSFLVSVDSGTQKQNARFNSEGPNYPSFYLSGNSTDPSRMIAVNSVPNAIIRTGTQTGYAPPRDQIVQYTMVYNGGTKILKLYINGVYYSEILITNPTPTVSIASASLGGLSGNSSRSLQGSFYSFMLYGRVLSDTEIQSIYSLNQTRFSIP